MTTPDFPDWTTPIGVERAAMVVDGVTIAAGGASPSYYDISAFGAITVYAYSDSTDDVLLGVYQSIEPRNLPLRQDTILCRNGKTSAATLSVAAPALLLTNKNVPAADNLHVTVVGTSNTPPVRFDIRGGAWSQGDEWLMASQAYTAGQAVQLAQTVTGTTLQGQVFADFRITSSAGAGKYFISGPTAFHRDFWIASTSELTVSGNQTQGTKMIALPAYPHQVTFQADAAFTGEVSCRFIPCSL